MEKGVPPAEWPTSGGRSWGLRRAGRESAETFRYRGTSLIRNTRPPRITIGP